jgi:aldose 1-epimerase
MMNSWLMNRPGRQFTLRNLRDMRVTISEHSAALVSWWAPDRYGRMADVLLGYPDENDDARNETCLHAAHWRGELTASGAGLCLRTAGWHGVGTDQPEVEVRYELADDGSLSIEYQAVAATPTLIHLGSHACFNLDGGRADIGDHMLQIDADRYLAIEAGGRLRDMAVSGTPFDFRRPAAIGPRLRWPHAQTGLAGGFDHCYLGAAAAVGGEVRQLAAIHDPGSGRRLQVSSTQAGLRFYSGKRLDDVAGRGHQPYARHAGFCLEARTFRERADRSQAPGVMLIPGVVHRETVIYRLSLLP